MPDQEDQGAFPFLTPELEVLSLSRLQFAALVPVVNQSSAAFMVDVHDNRTFVVKQNLLPSDVQAEAIGGRREQPSSLITPPSPPPASDRP